MVRTAVRRKVRFMTTVSMMKKTRITPPAKKNEAAPEEGAASFRTPEGKSYPMRLISMAWSVSTIFWADSSMSMTSESILATK